MRVSIFLFFALLLALPGRSQQRVKNVRIRVIDSVQLEIKYDLMTTRPGDSLYLEVRSRLRGALTILPDFVRGDIGTRLVAGSDRRIIWDALANGYSMNEEVQAKVMVRTGAAPVASSSVSTAPPVVLRPTVTSPKPEPIPDKPSRSEPVANTEPIPKPALSPAKASEPTRPRVKPAPSRPSPFALDTVQTEPKQPTVIATTPVPQQPTARPDTAIQPAPTDRATVETDTVRRRKSRYIGPAWALVSAIAPGIGNIFVQTPKPKIGLRPLLTVGCYGLIAYGLSERQKSLDEYAIYEQQKNMAAGEPYYQTANNHHHAYFIATRGAVLVAAIDVVATFMRGLQNNREVRRIQSVTLRPGLQAGQPTAVVRYSF